MLTRNEHTILYCLLGKMKLRSLLHFTFPLPLIKSFFSPVALPRLTLFTYSLSHLALDFSRKRTETPSDACRQRRIPRTSDEFVGENHRSVLGSEVSLCDPLPRSCMINDTQTFLKQDANLRIHRFSLSRSSLTTAKRSYPNQSGIQRFA